MEAATKQDVQDLSTNIRQLTSDVTSAKADQSKRMDRMGSQLDEIDKKLFKGNGKPGLVTQVSVLQTRCDQCFEVQDEKAKSARIGFSKVNAGVITAVIVGGIGLIFAGVRLYWGVT